MVALSSFRTANLLVVLLVLLVGPALTPDGLAEGAKKKPKRKKEGVPMSNDVEESLPEWEDDPKTRRELKCNACAVVVLEMAEALRTHRAEKYRKLTPDESIGALEWACGKIRTEYGLQMRNNK